MALTREPAPKAYRWRKNSVQPGSSAKIARGVNPPIE